MCEIDIACVLRINGPKQRNLRHYFVVRSPKFSDIFTITQTALLSQPNVERYPEGYLWTKHVYFIG